MIKAIAFDFDGVLAESVEVKTKAYAKIFEHENEDVIQKIVAYHIKHAGVSRFEKFKTISRDILKRPLSNNTFQSLCTRFSKLVVDEVVASPGVEGAWKFLENNKKLYSFFVVSGTPDEELKEIIRRRGMEKFFDEILGSPKTKDILLNQLMQKYELKPAEMVFVGDAETDWIGARKTGVRFIWRQISKQEPPLPGFNGPSIPSMAYLSTCLSEIDTPKT